MKPEVLEEKLHQIWAALWNLRVTATECGSGVMVKEVTAIDLKIEKLMKALRKESKP